jgi:hypothetical protein
MRIDFSAMAALALLLPACGPLGADTTGTTGELGNGVFSYLCDSDSDSVCDNGATGAQAMPKSVALGSRFSVNYSPSDPTDGSAIVEPVSEDFLTKTDEVASSFKALKAGTAGLLAKRGETVVDLLHLAIKAVDHLQVDATGDTIDGVREGVTALDLPVGRTLRLRALSVDVADEALAGALSCAWSTSDQAVAQVASLETDNEVTLQANAAGSATVRVQIEELAVEIALTVTGGEGGSGGQGGTGGTGGAGGAGGGQ